MTDNTALFEALAALEHERWADWQAYVHEVSIRNDDGSVTIPAALVARWERQIATAYANLSADEQDADRAQVRRYWPRIQAILAERDVLAAVVQRVRDVVTELRAVTDEQPTIERDLAAAGWRRRENDYWTLWQGPPDATGQPVEVVFPRHDSLAETQLYVAKARRVLAAFGPDAAWPATDQEE